MRILSRVCAEFRDRSGTTLLSIGPSRVRILLDAPETIRQDPLFDLLIAEGSLEVSDSRARQKELEADPAQGADASGKRKPSKSARLKETGEKPVSPGTSGIPGSSGSGPDLPFSDLPEAGGETRF